jgi:hypothetical protein
LTALQAFLPGCEVADLRIIDYIPYSRRRIISVHSPDILTADAKGVLADLWRLTTVPAPWTPEERWRAHQSRFPQEDDIDTERDFDIGPLEKEEATILEPDKLDIWAQGSHELDWDECLGMALRGRWASIGCKGNIGRSWWIYKAKDCR